MSIFSKITKNAENEYLEMVEVFIKTPASFKNIENILSIEGNKFENAMQEIEDAIAGKNQKRERETTLQEARLTLWNIAKERVKEFDENKEAIDNEWKGLLQFRKTKQISKEVYEYNAKAFEDFLDKMVRKFGNSFVNEMVYCDPMNVHDQSKVKISDLPKFKGNYEEYRKYIGWKEWSNFSDGICCFLLNVNHNWNLSIWLLEKTGRIQKGDIPSDSLRELLKYEPF